jgi:hypothetical protein
MKYLDFTDLLDTQPANLAVLSTYQLDPDFFERRLLRCTALTKARRILVFMDARQWFNLLRQDAPARFLNRRYLVVPVHRPQGVFHPKLNLLLTELGGQVLCGSNNLTRSGCSSNLELLNAFSFGGEGDSEEAIRLAQGAFGFFRRACDDGEEEPARIGRAWLEEAANLFPWLTQPLPANGSRRLRLLHTYEGSLWDRLVAAVDAAHASRLLVVSPFHDQDGEMLKRVRSRWPDCHVEVIVQQQITNLPVKALKKLQPSISLSELRNLKRRLHAKLVAWEGEEGTGCLVGSANFTAAAFDARNVETCLQVADTADAVRSLFDKELPKRTIAFEDFEPGSEQEPGPGDGPTTGLKLTSAALSGEGQLRVSYIAHLPARLSSLRVAIRTPGESLPRASAGVPNRERGTATVNLLPAALADAHGTILAFLSAESQGQRQESDPIWVIQEHRLTYEPSGEGSSSTKQKVEETGEGLTELLEEIGKRDGVAAVAEYLRHLNIRFNDGGNGLAVGRKFRLRVHDPFHPDVAPEWLVNFDSEAENLAEAISDFVERHEKRRLRKHARNGNINGMENFLDILTAMVRLLYVYYLRSLAIKNRLAVDQGQSTGYYGKSVKKKPKPLVTQGQLIGQVCTFIEIATGGIDTDDDYCNGFLLAVSENLNDPELLAEVASKTNFCGEAKAALMIVQKVRFVPNDPSVDLPPKRPSEGLRSISEKVRDTFAEVGLNEPSNEDVIRALEQYRMFTDKQMAEFRIELEDK